jgi:DeoR family transcriptional regulator, aga operon transcriptional repressor
MMPMPVSPESRKITERRKAILDVVAARQSVRVAELSSQLGVSEVSIRRDLGYLEGAGLLRRARGTAEAARQVGQLSVFEARLFHASDVKRAIGSAAAALVKPGCTIFLDSGTTVLQIAEQLPEILLNSGGLTIITRSLTIASELRKRRQVRLILLGGLYAHDFDDFVGASVEQALQEIHTDILFTGTDGVTAERGFTTDNVLEAGLYRKIIGCADRVVAVTDSSKIGVGKVQSIFPFEAIHVFITDSRAPQGFANLLRERGIEVITVPAPG